MKFMFEQSCSKESYLAKTILTAAVLGFVALPALAQQRNPERDAYFGETHLHMLVSRCVGDGQPADRPR